LRGVLRIVEHDGVQVAVPGVKDFADLKAVSIADLPDVAQRLRKFRTRNDAVKDIIAGGRRPSAPKAFLRPFQRRLRSALSRATRTSRA
jgi:hypothetical protein